MGEPTGSDELLVLAANEAFYDAFTGGDLDALDALWAERAPVACIHPGWDALYGREEVMESWRAILGGDHAPDVMCLNPTAHVLGDAAVVICSESINDNNLIATNVFVREDGRWKICHHQAGPVSGQRPEGQRRRARPNPGMLN
jgi:ketosteroid isomerase-like protein